MRHLWRNVIEFSKTNIIHTFFSLLRLNKYFIKVYYQHLTRQQEKNYWAIICQYIDIKCVYVDRKIKCITEMQKTPLPESLFKKKMTHTSPNVCVCVCVCVYIYIYIYIYMEKCLINKLYLRKGLTCKKKTRRILPLSDKRSVRKTHRKLYLVKNL